MSFWYNAGMVVGIVIGIIIVSAFLRYTRTDKAGKCSYDERQELVRGRGYKLGFFAIIAYEGLIALIKQFVEDVPVESDIENFIGICLGISVFVSYCIWNEGYFALNENPRKVLLFFFAVILLNVMSSIESFKEDRIIVDEKLSFGAVNLVCVVLFSVIFIVLFLKMLMSEKDRE